MKSLAWLLPSPAVPLALSATPGDGSVPYRLSVIRDGVYEAPAEPGFMYVVRNTPGMGIPGECQFPDAFSTVLSDAISAQGYYEGVSAVPEGSCRTFRVVYMQSSTSTVVSQSQVLEVSRL